MQKGAAQVRREGSARAAGGANLGGCKWRAELAGPARLQRLQRQQRATGLDVAHGLHNRRLVARLHRCGNAGGKRRRRQVVQLDVRGGSAGQLLAPEIPLGELRARRRLRLRAPCQQLLHGGSACPVLRRLLLLVVGVHPRQRVHLRLRQQRGGRLLAAQLVRLCLAQQLRHQCRHDGLGVREPDAAAARGGALCGSIWQQLGQFPEGIPAARQAHATPLRVGYSSAPQVGRVHRANARGHDARSGLTPHT